MDKLLNNKEWLTLSDAAKFLTGNLHRKVRKSDLIQLWFDRKMTVSVILKEIHHAVEGKPHTNNQCENITYFSFITESEKVESISGLVDLELNCNTPKLLERDFKNVSIGGCSAAFAGIIVKHDNGKHYQLLELKPADQLSPLVEIGGYAFADSPSIECKVVVDRGVLLSDYRRMSGLPADFTFVVRTSELAKFVSHKGKENYLGVVSSTNIVPIKPWEVADPKDPEPNQTWYISARYFARQLVLDDPTLLTKRNLLANKTSQSLFNAGVFGRTKNKALNAATILKAFNNIILS